MTVQRRSGTLLPVLAKPEVVSNGHTVVDRSTIKVEQEVGYRKFVYAVSAIFLLPVQQKMSLGGLFSPAMCVLRCAVASRLAQSAPDRQPTTGILLLIQRDVNIRRRRSQAVLLCRPEAFRLLICEFRQQYLRFPSNRK